jgi:V8-like Glu-specific endopeptidase
MRHALRVGLIVAFVAGYGLYVRADEGMWPLNRFPSAALKQRYGFAPTPQWLEQIQLGSVRFAGGCSGSFVSPSGLVMTNYHCVVSCVSALSDEKRNFQQSGFYATTAADERRCPGMELNQLTAMTDVTERVAAATKGTEGERFRAARTAAFATIERECATSDDLRCEVVTLYRGGKYDLYKYRRFQDVRLVFAPEFDTGFFGGDPDNFMFPRYNLDLSFVRAYDGGSPLKPTQWLRWSPNGAAAGDLVFVTGHPGTTSRLYTVAQLEFERDVRLPIHLMFYSELRGLLTEFRRRGAEEARVADAELVFVENSLKVLRGEFSALADRSLLERKRTDEAALRRELAGSRFQQRFGGAWNAVAAAAERRRTGWPRFAAFSRLTGSELFAQAQTLVRLSAEQAKPNEQRLREFSEAALPAVRQRIEASKPYSNELETVVLAHILTHIREQLGLDDPATKALLGSRSPDEVAASAISGTKLRDASARVALMKGGASAIAESTDPLIVLARAVDQYAREARRVLEDEIDSVVDRNAELIAQALFALRGDRVYPDATFTLRVTYGTVKGWTEGGREVTPFTTLQGLYNRHTGSAPFNLPARWLERKAHVALDTPFNLVADTDIIGGNSGSPMIDREGRIVGLIFDGNIHSLGGEFWFDASKNRAIAVDSRGIREALRSVYQADRVLAEIDGH